MRASGSHRLEGALEAVESHRPIALDDLERLVVVVAADIALCHGLLLSNFAAKGQRTATLSFTLKRSGIFGLPIGVVHPHP